MCRRVTCSKCGKASWAGCGAHVEQVLGSVPLADRCKCREAPRVASGASGANGGVGAGGDAGGALAKFVRFIKGG